jgi:hypothetical protein
MLSNCGNGAQVGLLAAQIRCITDSSDDGAFPNEPRRVFWARGLIEVRTPDAPERQEDFRDGFMQTFTEPRAPAETIRSASST